MKITVGTFNLFQFCAPPYSWYTRKERFTPLQWDEKISWIKNQIQKMNCDIIGFQEVFSHKELEELTKELGFEYYTYIQEPKLKKDTTIYNSTTLALASKYPISKTKKVKVHAPSLKKHFYKGHFEFSREVIKAYIKLPNDVELTCYVCHLKSNRLNEFEYTFTQETSLKEKKEKINEALKSNFSESLKQRLCEAASIFYDIKKQKDKPSILLCDLNDKEFSSSIEALSNYAYHYETSKAIKILHDASYDFKAKIYNPHPEQKEIKRTPTSFFAGYGNVLDYIFISKELHKKYKNKIAKVSNYEVLNEHLEDNPNGSLLTSDHAQVVCEIEFLN